MFLTCNPESIFLVICLPEMSGQWNFSVRVQSWSDKIESDPVLICKIFENHQSYPVLIRQSKFMFFLFCLMRKNNYSSYFAFSKIQMTEGKIVQQCFSFMRQNSHSLLAFPKFYKQVSISHQREKHCWNYFAVRRIWLLGMSSDKDDTLGLT